jgi:hypothetical protein
VSEKTKVLYYALWLMHPVLEIGIAGCMLKRRLARNFRFFFAYILTQLLTFAVVFPAYVWRSYDALFMVYWSANAISVIFGFLVIHEIFLDVFRTFHTLRDLGTVLFKWAGLVMLLVAAVVSVSANSSDISPLMQGILTLQRSVRIIQVGMVLLLLFFAQYVGVSRRQHSFGIALGFGSFAVIELILISSWVGSHLVGPWMSIVNMMAYNSSLGLWLGYVAVKRPARDSSRPLLQPQRWEQSLRDIHHPLPADSLIPMFEGMVDRALSGTQAPPEQHDEKATAGANGGPSTANFAAVIRATSER